MKKSRLIVNLLLIFVSIIFTLTLIEGTFHLIEFTKKYFEEDVEFAAGDYGNRMGYIMHCYQPDELALVNPVAAAKMMSDKKYSHNFHINSLDQLKKVLNNPRFIEDIEYRKNAMMINKDFKTSGPGGEWCARPGEWTSKKNIKNIPSKMVYDVTYNIDNNQRRITPTDSKLSKKPGKKGVSEPKNNKPQNQKYEGNINVFGGSWVFGEGLNDNETLPYYLQKIFPDYKVTNFGFHGWGPHNALYLLENNYAEFDSINILLTTESYAGRTSCGDSFTMTHPAYVVNKCKTCARRTTHVGNCSSVNETDYHSKFNSKRVKEPKDVGYYYPTIKKLMDNFKSINSIFENYSNFIRDIGDESAEFFFKDILYDFNNLSVEQNGTTLIAYLQSHPSEKLSILPDLKDSTFRFLQYHDIDALDVTLHWKDEESKYGYKFDPSLTIKNDGHPTSIANCRRAVLISKHLLNTKIIRTKNHKFNDQICELN